jgi:hypothetical protein
MADQDVGIEECGQRRRPARALRVRRSTSFHGVPRLPAGTATVPARSRKSGVFASTAVRRRTRKCSSSPSCNSSASRTLFGIVTWPFDVIFARGSMPSLPWRRSKDTTCTQLQALPARGWGPPCQRRRRDLSGRNADPWQHFGNVHNLECVAGVYEPAQNGRYRRPSKHPHRLIKVEGLVD